MMRLQSRPRLYLQNKPAFMESSVIRWNSETVYLTPVPTKNSVLTHLVEFRQPSL